MAGIFINRSDWEKFSESEMDEYRESVFAYYRAHGFPYFRTDDDWRRDEFQKFMEFDDSDVISGDEIRQTMHGLSFCWSFMPHAYSVQCNGFMSPYEAFMDDDTLRSVIRKRTMMGDNMSDNGLRKMLKIHTGVQGVSNFRPTAASAIYAKFAKGKVVWDMSAGYGGRMLGAFKAGVRKYIGTDPCTPTYDGLMEMTDFIRSCNSELLVPYDGCEMELHRIGSEEFVPDCNVDFCFTSPPYFDTEKYSDEDTQSWKRYGNREGWLDGFLKQTILNCRSCLVGNGVMAINIANVRSYPTMEEDTVRTAVENGFEHVCTMKYLLSSLSTKSVYKFEPVFMFRRKK